MNIANLLTQRHDFTPTPKSKLGRSTSTLSENRSECVPMLCIHMVTKEKKRETTVCWPLITWPAHPLSLLTEPCLLQLHSQPSTWTTLFIQIIEKSIILLNKPELLKNKFQVKNYREEALTCVGFQNAFRPKCLFEIITTQVNASCLAKFIIWNYQFGRIW